MKNTKHLKIPKKLKILDEEYTIKFNNSGGGANFDTGTAIIEIGTKYPHMIFEGLLYELSEVIHVLLSTRYDDSSVIDNYKFFMDHKEFQTHIKCLSSVLKQILKYNGII